MVFRGCVLKFYYVAHFIGFIIYYCILLYCEPPLGGGGHKAAKVGIKVNKYISF